jgi:16S rRNA (guanine527-N7)-methyltransferase
MEFANLLLDENRHTNLTGAKTVGELVREHFLDSLAPLGFVPLAQPIVDVGSGAGLPGIPVAIAFPMKKIVLLEPRAKRAAFLSLAADKLGLSNVTVIKASVRGPGAKGIAGRAGTVLVRAVAEPTTAFSLGLPLLRTGGFLVLYEGRSARATLQQRRAAHAAGGGDPTIKRVMVPCFPATRHAWIIRKEAAKTGSAPS